MKISDSNVYIHIVTPQPGELVRKGIHFDDTLPIIHAYAQFEGGAKFPVCSAFVPHHIETVKLYQNILNMQPNHTKYA